MQHRFARGLTAQIWKFDKPWDYLAQWSNPCDPNSALVYLINPIQSNLQNMPKVWLRSLHSTAWMIIPPTYVDLLHMGQHVKFFHSLVFNKVLSRLDTCLFCSKDAWPHECSYWDTGGFISEATVKNRLEGDFRVLSHANHSDIRWQIPVSPVI